MKGETFSTNRRGGGGRRSKPFSHTRGVHSMNGEGGGGGWLGANGRCLLCLAQSHAAISPPPSRALPVALRLRVCSVR